MVALRGVAVSNEQGTPVLLQVGLHATSLVEIFITLEGDYFPIVCQYTVNRGPHQVGLNATKLVDASFDFKLGVSLYIGCYISSNRAFLFTSGAISL